MAEQFIPVTPVLCTPGTSDAWVAVDADTYIADLPAGATGVALRIDTTASYKWGTRKNGSTDDRYDYLYGGTVAFDHCGIDGNHVFEVKIDSLNMNVYIIGYYIDVTFLTNATDISLSTTGAWTDIDTGYASGIGCIVEVKSISSDLYFGVRKNGSTDGRTERTKYKFAGSAIVGLASGVLEHYTSSTSLDLFLKAIITGGFVFATNATDLSLSDVDSYIDLSVLSSNAVANIVEIITNGTIYYAALRKNGSSEDPSFKIYRHIFGVVEADSNGVSEGKIDDLSLDFWGIGYAIPASEGGPYELTCSSSRGVSFLATQEKGILRQGMLPSKGIDYAVSIEKTLHNTSILSKETSGVTIGQERANHQADFSILSVGSSDFGSLKMGHRGFWGSSGVGYVNNLSKLLMEIEISCQSVGWTDAFKEVNRKEVLTSNIIGSMLSETMRSNYHYGLSDSVGIGISSFISKANRNFSFLSQSVGYSSDYLELIRRLFIDCKSVGYSLETMKKLVEYPVFSPVIGTSESLLESLHNSSTDSYSIPDSTISKKVNRQESILSKDIGLSSSVLKTNHNSNFTSQSIGLSESQLELIREITVKCEAVGISTSLVEKLVEWAISANSVGYSSSYIREVVEGLIEFIVSSRGVGTTSQIPERALHKSNLSSLGITNSESLLESLHNSSTDSYSIPDSTISKKVNRQESILSKDIGLSSSVLKTNHNSNFTSQSIGLSESQLELIREITVKCEAVGISTSLVEKLVEWAISANSVGYSDSYIRAIVTGLIELIISSKSVGTVSSTERALHESNLSSLGIADSDSLLESLHNSSTDSYSIPDSTISKKVNRQESILSKEIGYSETDFELLRNIYIESNIIGEAAFTKKSNFETGFESKIYGINVIHLGGQVYFVCRGRIIGMLGSGYAKNRTIGGM